MNHHLPLRNKLIIMGSVMASLLLVALDQTIVSTALGKIVEEFNAYSSLTWIVTAYMLTSTVTVPLAGKLSDLFGRRIMLTIGVAIFTLASLMSGTAGNVDQLVWARALQGIGGGIITANAFTIVADLFAARERGRWQGLIGAVFGLSSVVGPLLGGWLTDGQSILGMTTDWRWTFFINVPVGIVAFLLILSFCPPLKHAKKAVVDYLGASLLTLALATLVLAVDNTETIFADLLSATGLSLFGLRTIMAVIFLAATAGFIWVEKRSREPIIPLGFFKRRDFVLVVATSALFGAAFLGSILYLTQFNQQVFGAGPTESGMMLLPMVLGISLASIGAGQLIAKTGRYILYMRIGIVLAAVMIVSLTTLRPGSTYLYEAILMLLLGIGLGLVMPVLTTVVQAEFAQKEIGVATSSVQLFRGLGSTIGVSIFGAMLTAGMASGVGTARDTTYIHTISQSPAISKIGSLDDANTLLTLNMPHMKENVTAMAEQLTSHLPARAKQPAMDKFEKDQEEYSSIITHTFSDSLRNIFLMAAGLMFTAIPCAFLIKERELKSASPDVTPGEL